jgi:hypothetical protein
MIENENIKLLLNEKEFKTLIQDLNLNANYCCGNIYIYNESYSLMLMDVVQEYEISAIFYHRHENKFSQNFYSVCVDLEGNEDFPEFVSNISIDDSSIEFDRLGIALAEKKRSILFVFWILLSNAISIVVDKWEKCMK